MCENCNNVLLVGAEHKWCFKLENVEMFFQGGGFSGNQQQQQNIVNSAGGGGNNQPQHGLSQVWKIRIDENQNFLPRDHTYIMILQTIK